VYVEEAEWIRQRLAAAPLPDPAAVLNAGSSTEHFRTVEQPHIEREVLAPLRARGATITHLDMKQDPGVDIVFDLTRVDLDPEAEIGRRFDLVLATGLLEHFELIGPVARVLKALVAPGGMLLVTTPERYRRTPDPVDYGYRPSPEELEAEFCDGDADFRAIASASVRIDDSRYYKGLVSRASWVPLKGRWVPLPGFSERIRHRFKRLRWRESCVLLQRTEI
jgi:SAM-dependent methyltransferase